MSYACKFLHEGLLPEKSGKLGILKEFFFAWKDQGIPRDFLFPKL